MPWLQGCFRQETPLTQGGVPPHKLTSHRAGTTHLLKRQERFSAGPARAGSDAAVAEPPTATLDAADGLLLQPDDLDEAIDRIALRVPAFDTHSYRPRSPCSVAERNVSGCRAKLFDVAPKVANCNPLVASAFGAESVRQ